MNRSILGKLLLSFVLCTVVIISSSFLVGMLGMTFAYFNIMIPLMFVSAITIAPVFEEYGKRMALIRGFPWFYTSVFAGIEAWMYFVTLSDQGISLEVIILSRTLAIMMHFGTMWIQIKFKNMYDAKGRMGTNWDKLGYYNAVCTHALWNAVCVACMLSS